MIKKEDVLSVKKLGFLRNRGTDMFSGRVITKNGVLSADEMKTVCDAAKKFGSGKVAFTTRLTVEIPGIPFEKIQAFREYIAQSGLETGGTGTKIRPVVACKGTTCVFGLYDTQGLAEKIHNRFYDGYRNVLLPHKFKITVGGCPNNCAKPELNDIGIVGQLVPDFNSKQCRECKKCLAQEACPMDAFSLREKSLSLDSEKCNNCGRCTRGCLFGALSKKKTLYKVYIGGRWGKQTRKGDALSKLFSGDELMYLIEKIILFFKENGKKGERFASLIERIGIDAVEKEIFSDDILSRKNMILSK